MGDWSRSDPWWKKMLVFHILDFFLGRIKCTTIDLSVGEVLVRMPEKTYHGTGTLQDWTWKRPLWFARRRRSVNVSMDEPIPDCGKDGDDALCGAGADVTTFEEAAEKMKEIVTRNRLRYGGPNWRPPEDQVRRDVREASGGEGGVR